MPIYYFEVEIKQTGWLRMEADSESDAREDIDKHGFNAPNIIDSHVTTKIIDIEGGEEEED